MLKNIKILLTKNQRTKCILLLISSMFASTFELIGIGSIPVFAMVIVDINIFKSKFSSFVDPNLLDQFNQNQIALFGAIILALIFLLKNFFLISLKYWETRVALVIRTSIRLNLFNSYIRAPYIFYLHRNPAELLRSIEADVTYAASIIVHIITLFKEILLLIMIFSLLFYV